MIHIQTGETFKMNTHHGRDMKDHVDKSRGIVTLIAEALGKIKPTYSLRLSKQSVHRKRNWSRGVHDKRYEHNRINLSTYS